MSPVTSLLLRRVVLGVLTIVVLSVVVFAATQILPGDAAQVILGRSATPERLAALRGQLQLDLPPLARYLSWAVAMLHGDPGLSLATGQPVAAQVGPNAVNSLILVGLVIGIAVPLSAGAGIAAGLRPGGWLDTLLSGISLVVVALPEFVVAIALIIVFATTVLHVLPPVSMVLPGFSPLDDPRILVLPVATLAIVVFPYLFRMIRASIREIMDSDYIEMARLKGLSPLRVVVVHALPNAAAPFVQVTALTVTYLCGGVAVVEYVFGYPGLGALLISSVTTRDVPVLQAVILLLAAIYVVTNALSDVLALMLAPRGRPVTGGH